MGNSAADIATDASYVAEKVNLNYSLSLIAVVLNA